MNGERNGKGKEYNENGKIIFEGEYLNGRRNGKGKEYFNCKLKYEEEYSNGLRNGKGKEYYYLIEKIKIKIIFNYLLILFFSNKFNI